MLLKEAITIPCGLRYMISALELHSGASRQALLETTIMTDPARIENEYRDLHEFVCGLLTGGGLSATGKAIALHLESLKELRGTLTRLEEGGTADDVDLFEIKRFVLLCGRLAPLLARAGIRCIELPDTGAIAALLDPEGFGTASFHVYDCYDPELAAVRKRIAGEPERADELTALSLAIEDRVRKRLSDTLRDHLPVLRQAFAAAIRTDILLAKALQASRPGMTVPTVASHGPTSYRGMFNPEIREAVESSGGRYQPVDIVLDERPVCIVGTNMGGKTVVLKTLALCQLLTQWGFAVPVREAHVVPCDGVCLSLGEERPQRTGLSSFAAEVEVIGAILRRARTGERLLALVDEPARTTNPTEGRALAEGLIDTLGTCRVRLAVTTHYNLDGQDVRRLKVRGYDEQGMDYTLEEIATDDVPHEALSVAERLGADAGWLACARNRLNEHSNNRQV